MVNDTGKKKRTNSTKSIKNEYKVKEAKKVLDKEIKEFVSKRNKNNKVDYINKANRSYDNARSMIEKEIRYYVRDSLTRSPIACIIIAKLINGNYARGVSICSYLDNFNRTTAIAKAHQRLWRAILSEDSSDKINPKYEEHAGRGRNTIARLFRSISFCLKFNRNHPFGKNRLFKSHYYYKPTRFELRTLNG